MRKELIYFMALSLALSGCGGTTTDDTTKTRRTRTTQQNDLTKDTNHEESDSKIESSEKTSSYTDLNLSEEEMLNIYNEASRLYSNGKREEAVEAFRSINGYKDSFELANRIVADLADFPHTIEKEPSLEGKNLLTILAPANNN